CSDVSSLVDRTQEPHDGAQHDHHHLLPRRRLPSVPEKFAVFQPRNRVYPQSLHSSSISVFTTSNIFFLKSSYITHCNTKCFSSSISPDMHNKHLLSCGSSLLSLFVFGYLPVSILNSFGPPLSLVMISLACGSSCLRYGSNLSVCLSVLYVRSFGFVFILSLHSFSSLSCIFSIPYPMF